MEPQTLTPLRTECFPFLKREEKKEVETLRMSLSRSPSLDPGCVAQVCSAPSQLQFPARPLSVAPATVRVGRGQSRSFQPCFLSTGGPDPQRPQRVPSKLQPPVPPAPHPGPYCPIFQTSLCLQEAPQSRAHLPAPIPGLEQRGGPQAILLL